MLKEEFTDTTTQKGFTYEIEETIRCVRAKKTESPVVPHATTIACAELFDQIQTAKKRVNYRKQRAEKRRYRF